MTLFDDLPDWPPAPHKPAPKSKRKAAATATDTIAPPAPPLADGEARRLIRNALDTTLVVEAAAGTGKTTELVSRMVALLEAGRGALDRMVSLTFTEAAAGELKLRLRAAIEVARLDESRPAESRARLTAELPRLEEARIGTIHSFCADLLREHPVEAAVDPRFEVAPEDVARPLFERAFARWFEGQLEAPGPGVQRILRRWKREPMFGPRRRDEGPRGLLRNAAWQLVEHRDFPSRWRRPEGFERNARIDDLMDELESLADQASRGDPEDWFTKSLLEVARFVHEVRRAERMRERDYDALEARLCESVIGKQGRHWGWRGSRFSSEFPRTLRDRRDALHARLKAFGADAGADLAPLLRDELWPVVEAYESAKIRTGCLDFNDLLIRARNLVRDDPRVRRTMQERFTHYFVDEFQDTDPLQAEILLLLAGDDPGESDWRSSRPQPGKLFVVGDPKQSIYRFRRADVALYEDVKRRLVSQGATLAHLTVSFRAVPEIQAAVNAAFAPRLGGVGSDGRARDYVPLSPFREGLETQPAVIALPVPAPYGDYGKVVEWKIAESLPDTVAAWIDWLVNASGWTVTERERPGERVPVEPRHVCILFRRFKSFGDDVTRPYVTALETRHLPHLLVGGSSFHEREEIEALRNALAAIERPDDEMSVFATLRGPLLALSDAQLLTWRERVGGLHPFRLVPDGLSESLVEVADCLALLRELHRGRNRRPVADTIARLLESTRAHAALAIWPTGIQALANVSRLMDMARRAEHNGIVSFRAFVDRLEDDAARGEAAEAPLLEEGVEGVRIMTVHKAKGLEFPVVVLADMTAKDTHDHPSRWTDASRGLTVQRLANCAPVELLEHGAEEMEREREEAVRLLYVAATRARDALVVPVVGDERREGWLAALHLAVHPTPATARAPQREAPGTPPFGDDSVPRRPGNVARPMASVMPGLHLPEAGTHRVVWWDPAVLALDVRATIGLAQTRILEADEGGRSGAALTRYEEWRVARATRLERGAVPTRRVQAATEWVQTAEPDPAAAAVQVLNARWPGERPQGRAFGTLVHVLMSVVGLDDDRVAIAAHAEVQTRLLAASDADCAAAIEVVAAALAHPLLRRAAAGLRGRCRRESALVVRLADGTLIESVADLAFEEDEGWTVVDFKTDAELGTRLDLYRRQVALYASAVAEATGRPARGFLLAI